MAEGLAESVWEEVLDSMRRVAACYERANSVMSFGLSSRMRRASSIPALAASRGAKAIPLKVSGAWHSELIKGAQEKFGEFMESVHFSTPDRPMLFNVTGDYAINTDDIKSIIVPGPGIMPS